MGRYPVVTICGSMRYFEEMLLVANKWTGEGWIVLMPFVTKGGPENAAMLDEMHKRKIDMADRVIIYGDHIGESTQSEWEYALFKPKAITRIFQGDGG